MYHLQDKTNKFRQMSQLNSLLLMQSCCFFHIDRCYVRFRTRVKSPIRLHWASASMCSYVASDMPPINGPFTPNVCVNAGDNSVMMLIILFSLKTMESLQNVFASYSGATPFFSMRAESLASWRSCRSIDADTRCKQAPKLLQNPLQKWVAPKIDQMWPKCQHL